MRRYGHAPKGIDFRYLKCRQSKLWRSLLLTAMASVVFLTASREAKAEWPDHVIRLIVPFGAGSSSDTIARIIAVKLSEQLSQRVIVENKVGASTIIGTDFIAKSVPDGYTLGLANTSSHAASTAFTPNLPFDPIKDFTPIAMIGSSPFLLIAPPQANAKTLEEFIARAKADPGKLSYASAGTATLTHLAGELLKWKTNINVIHVPYRGSEQSIIDLMAGRIDLLVGTIAPTLASIRQGNLRAYAIMSETRSPLLPDVPTVGEAGAPGCEAALWTALVAPKGVSGAIITRLNQAVSKIVNSPEVQETLKTQGVTPESGSPEAVAERIRVDVIKWKEIAEKISDTK